MVDKRGIYARDNNGSKDNGPENEAKQHRNIYFPFLARDARLAYFEVVEIILATSCSRLKFWFML